MKSAVNELREKGGQLRQLLGGWLRFSKKACSLLAV